MIFNETYYLLKDRYIREIDNLVLSDVRIGLYLTAVRLSDNSVGTSSTLPLEHPFCLKENRDFGDFSPLKIRGKRVTEILETDRKSQIISSLKIAVLNAISSGIIFSGKYKVKENCDPIQLVDLEKKQTITIVGAFHSYIRKISETGNRLFVLEKNKKALRGEFHQYYVEASQYEKVVPDSDVLLITGQTLVNGTIDELLSLVSPGCQVIVAGPSCGIIPDVLFEKGVSIVGGTRITRPEIVFSIVSEGGLGYHLLEYCAAKICILGENEGKAE